MPPPPSPEQMQIITQDLAAAARLAETRFQDIGQGLQDGIARLDRMTSHFAALHARLGGAELLDAMQVLTGAAQQVGGFAAARGVLEATLARLATDAASVRAPLATLQQIAGEIGILALNARITAAGMGAHAGDFMLFAGEIATSSQRSEANLRSFADALGRLAQDLRAAQAEAARFASSHADDIAAIPRQLTATVESIAARTQSAAEAAAHIAERSRIMTDRIGRVVVAMQLGDITRQRIEHVMRWADCVTAAPPDGAVPAELNALTPRQWAAAADMICRIAAAQLTDTADALDSEGAQIETLLQGLIGDAADIAAAGQAAYADIGVAEGTFLGALADHVRDAHRLIRQLQEAQDAASTQLQAALNATRGLLSRIAAVRAIEADVHVMGLNTILKCGRLGREGRPLAVIAQALRACGNRTAAAAGGVLDGLQLLLRGTEVLLDPDRALAAGAMVDSIRMVSAAEDRLASAQRHLAAALDELMQDSLAVRQGLDASLQRFAARQEIADAARRAGAVFEALATGAADDGDGGCGPVLAWMAGSYTMAREREVHRRFAGGPAITDDAAPAAPPGAAAEELADLLF